VVGLDIVFCLGAELNRGSFGGALCVQSVRVVYNCGVISSASCNGFVLFANDFGQ